MFFIRNFRILLLVVFAWTHSLRGNILSYDASSRELYIRCPKNKIETGKVMFAGLWRQQDNRLLARWDGNHDDPGQVLNYSRASVRPATAPHVLDVVLRYVTCYDVTTYTCNMLITTPKDSLRTNESESFTLEGEITQPVLRAEPRKARYEVGDALKLTCSARVGTNSSIVWETRLPEDKQFSLQTSCVTGTNITEHKTWEYNSKACGVTSVSSMTHILRPDDDNREWRCRLNNTNLNAFFAVAVQCPDGEGCFKQCRSSGQSTEKHTETGSTPSQLSDQVQASAMEVKGHAESPPVESPPTMLILIAVICVLFVTMVISIVIMTAMLKKQTKKQLSPLIISPPPSEYTMSAAYNARARSLPHLPLVDHYALHEDEDLHLFSRRDEDETPPKIFSPTTSSIYISMSAVPSLHDEPRGYLEKGDVRSRDEAGVQDRRSESIYSNRDACDTDVTKVSDTTVSSRDSHVTMGNLKGWM